MSIKFVLTKCGLRVSIDTQPRMPLVPVIPLFVFLDVLESNIIPCNYKHNYHHDIMFKTLKNLKHFTFLNTAVQNRNIGIAVAFSVVGVVAGAVAMWFYMRRKSAKPKPQSMLFSRFLKSCKRFVMHHYELAQPWEYKF